MVDEFLGTTTKACAMKEQINKLDLIKNQKHFVVWKTPREWKDKP